MSEALGMIETRGLAISIEVADRMLKTSNVSIVNQETVDLALVTIIVKGDVSSVQSAVELGESLARSANAFVSSKVIPHPDTGTSLLIKEKAVKESVVHRQQTSAEKPLTEEKKNTETRINSVKTDK
ncbi:hypothetical protein AC623_07200 [Bacillus sp. FJAT-27231]|uniref:BMC domain-containing protein n=1 Tax=Bacillus sp. FJAT-27231 TaxID=1679168 RepID=UPI00069CE51D|nr:BMC domain-containing protein [Bacillus sp. FJAT-27231]KMY53785.1 hypothetical protein AC623_07200 [Bacillus sp. FJAT-27231]